MTPDDVLDFWFSDEVKSKWFGGGPEFDAEIRERFYDLYGLALRGELPWSDQPRSALAMVIVLDQFPRNLFRNDARAFETDALALSVAQAAVDRGFDQTVTPEQRTFFYLPFEHSEEMWAQDRSVELFTALGDANTLDFAKHHRDIIARFGRFPHRNAVLDRPSTAEEIAAGATVNPF